MSSTIKWPLSLCLLQYPAARCVPWDLVIIPLLTQCLQPMRFRNNFWMMNHYWMIVQQIIIWFHFLLYSWQSIFNDKCDSFPIYIPLIYFDQYDSWIPILFNNKKRSYYFYVFFLKLFQVRIVGIHLIWFGCPFDPYLSFSEHFFTFWNSFSFWNYCVLFRLQTWKTLFFK